MKRHNTDEIPDEMFLSSHQSPDAGGQATRFIDVHIYDVGPQVEEPPIVESEQEPEPVTAQEHEEDPSEPPQEPRRRHVLLPLAGLLTFALLSVLAIVVLLPALIPPEASITIVPVSQQITTSSTLTVTTGQVTESTQLPGRALAAVTMSQQQTVPTTGKAHQDARAAHGVLTFYNAATYSQVVPAGTIVTGADGVQVVTDQDAAIAPASYPTFGAATVAAHAVIAGPAGNIAGSDIYGPCCRLNLSAVNSPFTGGQQARDYQIVAPQDIRSVVTRLTTGIVQSVQAALQTQVRSDETLMTPLPCQQSITPNHKPGEEATQVQVTISETCHGMIYSTSAYQARLTQIITQHASKQLGQGYTLTGTVQQQITKIEPNHRKGVTLQVHMAAIYAYQFTQEQQAAMCTLVAGKSKAQATTTLLQVPGVQRVSISLDKGSTLPTESSHIRLLFLSVG